MIPTPTPEILDEYRERGLVSGSRHPFLPLTVWCSTPEAESTRLWDDVTCNTRGLVLDDEGQVVGRGLPKMFAAEDPLAQIPPPGRYTAYDLVDGTGIHVAEYDGQLVVWTKDSFTTRHSEEALNYLSGWEPQPGTTALFEGLFGWNRVVVDYEFRGLVLLGAVDNETGRDGVHPMDVAAATGWASETAVERNGIRPAQLANMCRDPENGAGREGFVVVWPRDDGPSVRHVLRFASYLSASSPVQAAVAPRKPRTKRKVGADTDE